MKKHKADLSEWRLDFDLVANKYFFYGKIYKDELKRFEDGKRIRTSELLKIDFQTMTAETKNTIYNLKDMGYNL